MTVVRVHGGAFLSSQTLSGGLRYFQIQSDAGNEFHFALGDPNRRVASLDIVNGGTGFVAGDVGSTLSVTGGTGTAATFVIVSVSNGAIASLAALNTGGDYSAAPTNPVATSGGGGSGCTLNLDFSSTIIIPDANGNIRYVGWQKPVPGSAVDRICEVIMQRASIVQIAFMPVGGFTTGSDFQVALANTSMSWDTPLAGTAAQEIEAAIQALGTITVPDTTSNGLSVDLSVTTVVEKFLSSGLNI